MKEWALMFLCLFSIALLVGGADDSWTWTRTDWATLRAVSATDDTGFAAGDCNWSSISTIVVGVQRAGKTGAVQIFFKGTDAENETFNWTLYAVKGDDCPAEYVAHGTGTLGATTTGETNEYYADTIVITNEDWYTSLSIKDGYQYNLGTGAVAGAGISVLHFDSCEYRYFIMKMSKGTCATAGAMASSYY